MVFGWHAGIGFDDVKCFCEEGVTIISKRFTVSVCVITEMTLSFCVQQLSAVSLRPLLLTLLLAVAPKDVPLSCKAASVRLRSQFTCGSLSR
jgi:hypothetical protein